MNVTLCFVLSLSGDCGVCGDSVGSDFGGSTVDSSSSTWLVSGAQELMWLSVW